MVVAVAKHDADVHARVPSDLLDAVRESNTDVSEAVRTGLKLAAYGEEVAEAEAKNDVAREQWEATDAAIDDLLAEFENRKALTSEEVTDALATLRESRAEAVDCRMQERVQQAQTAVEARQEDELADALADLDAMVQSGEHVWTGHARVQELASEFQMPPEQIIDRLRERNPDVPAEQFEKRKPYETGRAGRVR